MDKIHCWNGNQIMNLIDVLSTQSYLKCPSYFDIKNATKSLQLRSIKIVISQQN